MNPIHPALAPLARAAKALHPGYGDACVSLMCDLLRAAAKDPGWLRPEHRIGDPSRYMRHLLYVDPEGDFVITAITWLPGQVSPVHGHKVWCAFAVAEGQLTEEQFSDESSPRLVRTRVYRAGDLADRDLDGKLVHRVANRSASPIVSLHLYGVAAELLTTGINRLFT